MSDTPRPEPSPEQPPDLPGPLPELPALDPLGLPEDEKEPSDGPPAPAGVPLVHPPGTQ